jgi:putative ATP-dependent endonuclease of OLD family
MSRIRRVEIRHFRGIASLDWFPSSGVNCLIGPGDIGKSTVLDAIDLCLGRRRTLQFTDADFHKLDTASPIDIRLTIGELEDELKRLDSYGFYLRGFRADSLEVLPEPEAGAETVLSVVLTVASDLEPEWSLYSERAEEQGQSRKLAWADRLRLAPTRLGAYADYNLGWGRGSVLNRISDERANASAELAEFARQARRGFGESAKAQVGETLKLVKSTASDLGIIVGEVTAMLDAESVSFSGGTISLHDGDGVPLRGLGLGSVRLLTAGLQRMASTGSSTILIDEIEYGLEPHRLIRLLTSLGSKEKVPVVQSFITTHSPVAVRELPADQLHVLRRSGDGHEVRRVGLHDAMQATIRACPESLLAPAVVVCEGATEIGFLRGIDLFRVDAGKPSIAALGIAIADGHGETTYRRANALVELGYRVLVLRDADKEPNVEEAAVFSARGGRTVSWADGNALEQELFRGLSAAAVSALLEAAVKRLGEEFVDANIRSTTDNALNLAVCRESDEPAVREALGRAAKSKHGGWFKSVSEMESAARDVIGPDLSSAAKSLSAPIDEVFSWAVNE